MKISEVIPIRTVSEANSREHWRAKHKRAQSQRQVVKMVLYNHRFKLPGHDNYVVTLTRIAQRQLDGDNLQRSFKAIRDQVAVEIGVDDGSKRITWQYEQKKGAPKEYAVKVEVDCGK